MPVTNKNDVDHSFSISILLSRWYHWFQWKVLGHAKYKIPTNLPGFYICDCATRFEWELARNIDFVKKGTLWGSVKMPGSFSFRHFYFGFKIG